MNVVSGCEKGQKIVVRRGVIIGFWCWMEIPRLLVTAPDQGSRVVATGFGPSKSDRHTPRKSRAAYYSLGGN
jgi:hypothetical protein